MIIDHKIIVNDIVRDYKATLNYHRAGAVIDGETFECMDFSRLVKHQPGVYTYTRKGYTHPHRIFISIGWGWIVYMWG